MEICADFDFIPSVSINRIGTQRNKKLSLRIFEGEEPIIGKAYINPTALHAAPSPGHRPDKHIPSRRVGVCLTSGRP
jgi:hypothetical protein